MVECVLCNPEQLRKSRVYYEDDEIMIVDNIKLYEFDRRIMGLIKPHIKLPSRKLKEKLINSLDNLAKGLFRNNYGYHCFQDGMNTFPDHYHIHLCYPKSNAVTDTKTFEELIG